MAFGTAARLKSDVAEGAVLALGRVALRRAGAIGLVRFGAPGAPRITPLRAGRPGLVALRRAVDEGVAPDGVAEPGALHDACVRIARIARQPGMVVVVSDFRDQEGFASALGTLRSRHTVLCVEVNDPREGEVPPVGRLAVVDPETGRLVRVDTSSRRVRERFAELEAQRRETLASELRRLRIAHVSLSTRDDWLVELGRWLG
jgi:uncharacterized protein (DUF58 family)